MLINAVDEFIRQIKIDIEVWPVDSRLAWFRGEKWNSCNQADSLRPKLFKKTAGARTKEKSFIENEIIQNFRMRARAFPESPSYERIDEWLFLMQHVEVPTRLLDWTEGALIALFFAVNRPAPKKDEIPVVWMMNPVLFNSMLNSRHFLPLSWNDGSNIYDKKTKAFAYGRKLPKNRQVWLSCPSNIQAAFEQGKNRYEENYPLALKPQHIHQRVTVQRGAFTVHGKDKRGMVDIIEGMSVKDKDPSDIFLRSDGSIIEMLSEILLKQYQIDPCEKVLNKILGELRMLGISHSTLFPELTGLGNDINTEIFSV